MIVWIKCGVFLLDSLFFFLFISFALMLYLNLDRNVLFFSKSFFLDRTVGIFIKLNGILFVNMEFDIIECCKIEYNVLNDGHSQWISIRVISILDLRQTFIDVTSIPHNILSKWQTHEKIKKQRKNDENTEPFGVRTFEMLVRLLKAERLLLDISN